MLCKKKLHNSRKDAQKYTNKLTVYFFSNIMMHGASNDKKKDAKYYQVRKMKKYMLVFDWLVKNLSLNLRIVRLNVNHAVTLWSDWIFDSNFEYAIPLTNEWLLHISGENKKNQALEGRELILSMHIKKREHGINNICTVW